MLDFNNGTVLSIPRPQYGLAPLQIDLTIAYKAESHIKEIAAANQSNALWFASVFSEAYNSLSRAYGALHYEVASAAIAARKKRAVLVLDVAPRIAKEKGLSSTRSPTGSEDVREAICYSDPEYAAIEEYRAALEAAKELVFLKLRAMQMAYDATKAIVRGTSGTAGNQLHAAEPEVMMENAMELVMNEPKLVGVSREASPAPRKSGFGIPR